MQALPAIFGSEHPAAHEAFEIHIKDCTGMPPVFVALLKYDSGTKALLKPS